MNVVRANGKDKTLLLDISRAYYNARYFETVGIEFDDHTVENYVNRSIAVLAHDEENNVVGAVGGVVVPLIMVNATKHVFQENMAWARSPEIMATLKEEISAYAKELGATVYVRSCFDDTEGPRLRRL